MPHTAQALVSLLDKILKKKKLLIDENMRLKEIVINLNLELQAERNRVSPNESSGNEHQQSNEVHDFWTNPKSLKLINAHQCVPTRMLAN